jgi:hypothetical protein
MGCFYGAGTWQETADVFWPWEYMVPALPIRSFAKLEICCRLTGIWVDSRMHRNDILIPIQMSL